MRRDKDETNAAKYIGSFCRFRVTWMADNSNERTGIILVNHWYERRNGWNDLVWEHGIWKLCTVSASFSWCGIVESKEAHTLHMAKEEIFIRFITLKFSAYYLSKGLCGIPRHLIIVLLKANPTSRMEEFESFEGTQLFSPKASLCREEARRCQP